MEENGVTMGTVTYFISLFNTGKHWWMRLAFDFSRKTETSWCDDSRYVSSAFNGWNDLRQAVRQYRILGNAFVQRAEFIWQYIFIAVVLLSRGKDLSKQDF